MTDDRLFGETDFEERISELEGEIKRLNAFIVSKDLATEYLKWNKEGGI